MNRLNTFYKSMLLAMLFSTATVATSAQVASGTPYTLEQSVTASGGGTSVDAGNTFSITGSIGQPITGTSGNTPFTIKSGFFNAPAVFAPTAASVTVSGRVTTASGRGIRNVIIFMSDGNGTLRTAGSSGFGYSRFSDVAAGETYIFTAKAKRFQFSHPTQVISISEDFTDLNFVAAGTP